MLFYKLGKKASALAVEGEMVHAIHTYAATVRWVS